MTPFRVVETDAYRLIGESVLLAAEEHVPVVILGASGTGKSEAIDQHAPPHTVFLPAPPTRTREAAIRTLFESLLGASLQKSHKPRGLLDAAREELRRREPLLVADPVAAEHEKLLALAFELWDAGDRFGLIAAGDSTSDVALHRVPELRYTATVIRVEPMTSQEVAECVPLLHPMFERTSLPMSIEKCRSVITESCRSMSRTGGGLLRA